MAAPQTIPTVSRLHKDTIVELVYDAERNTTALIVAKGDGWKRCQKVELNSGEVLVPYAASNNLLRHGCVLLPAEPVPYGSKEELVHDIQNYLHRYVDLSPTFERIAAHYILLTWVFDAFNELPYLRFRGDYGSGKTRALIALGSIAYKGFFASGASTISPIFHTLDRFSPTLILDEADLRFSDKTADLVKIFNNGTVKGLPVLRTLQNRDKEFNPAAFSVYGPKIVAMRGSFRDEALESRFITEDMGTRALRKDIPIQLPQTLKAEALNLRNRLLQFRLTNLFVVKTDPDRAIAEIGPRFNQTALSLLSLVDNEDVRQDIANTMRAQERRVAAQRSQSMDAHVLRALQSLLEREDAVPLRLIAEQATAGFGEPGISARQAGQVLRSRGIGLFKSHGIIVVRRGDVHHSSLAA